VKHLSRNGSPIIIVFAYVHGYPIPREPPLPTKLSQRTAQPNYLHSPISVQPPRGTRSSSVVTLSQPPTSSLRIIDRSFRYASPHLWNQIPVSFRQPYTKHPADDVTLFNSSCTTPCGLRGCKNGPAPFPGRMSYKTTKPGLVSVLYLSIFFIVLFIRAPLYVLLVFIVCVLSFGCSSFVVITCQVMG